MSTKVSSSNTATTTTTKTTSTTTTTAAAAATAATTASSKDNNNNTSNNNTADKKQQQQLKYIASVVRALVTSRKQPCTLREILREYPEVESKPIPFKQNGFNSAEDLLRETGEFIFTRIGGETCIAAKYNTKTAHITSMVRAQKSSKTTRITQVKQVRQPHRSDQSWNKSSYSSNVYQKLPPSANRFIESQNRANNTNSNWGGDRNNNNSNQSNNRNSGNNNQQQQQQHQQLLQRQKSGGGNNNNVAAGGQPKDLREMLNSKLQQNNNNNNNNNSNNNNASAQRDLRSVLNSKAQQQQQEKQKMQNGNKPDLRERLNAKQQQQQQQYAHQKHQMQQQQQQHQQQHQQQKQNGPRAILGQNSAASQQKQHQQQQQQQSNAQQQQQQQQQQPQQKQQLLQNNTAVAIASTMILAQRQQKIQEQRHQQQRAELLSIQKQQQQQQLQNQNIQTRPFNATTNSNGATGFQKMPTTPMAGAGNSSSSVQDRLKIRIKNSNNINNNTTYANGANSAGITPETSPAISSAGSEHMNNPFATSQQPQFHKQQKYVHHQQQQQQQRNLDTQPVIPPKVFQFNPKLDPITSLSQYCLVRGCKQPEYSIVKSKFSRLYQCRVRVNESIFSTYPNEFPNEHMAKIACALQAIEQIKVQEARRPLPPCTDSDHELVNKIFNELLTHRNGVFAKNITEWFETTYQQALPEHWWSLVQSSNRFTTETAPNNNIILFANLDADKDDALSLSGPTTNTVIQMEGITLPWSQKYWDLCITHCSSTVEVWARLFGKDYGEKFDNLMNDIDMLMLTEKARPLSIANKQIYLVCIAECWHRVRVEEMDKLNGTALCFFIDFGDADWLPVSQLHICDPKFLKLPAQAVPFSLFGLEDFAGNPNARRHLDALLASKSVVGEILTKEADFYAADSSCGGKIQVVLYDTSSQDDVNLNPLILNHICDDTPPPELKRTGVTNVLVTHVSDVGDLYLQILNSDLKYVQKLIQELIESKFKRDQHKISPDDLKRSNLFLICDDSGDGQQQQWYRGALTESHYSLDDEDFDIFYVDHGRTRRTHISKIFRLESLSTALSKFPRQAIKARLYNIPDITKGIVGRMRALLPPNCEALVKMSTPSTVPLITVYTRIVGHDTLSTINDVIRIEHELESSADLNTDGNGVHAGSTSPTDTTKNGGFGSPNTSLSPRNNSFVDVTRGLTITSVPNSPQKSGELPKLKNYEAIPVVGDFFEVRVTMSANPSNFTIQPYKDYPRLKALMKELQEYCENNDEFIPVDMVEIGQAYAAKNPDGFYHRVTVVNTYSGEMIHVCFCDFGDIAILRSDHLKILPAKFRQLPKMAIQAKLYGIAASHVDWTLEDCLRFRELTVGQKFVSTIKRISYDKLNTPDTQVLELDLIDVTTEDDIFIRDLLLKEKRAIEVESTDKEVGVH